MCLHVHAYVQYIYMYMYVYNNTVNCYTLKVFLNTTDV